MVVLTLSFFSLLPKKAYYGTLARTSALRSVGGYLSLNTTLLGYNQRLQIPKENIMPRNARVGGQVTLTIGAEPIHQISAIKLSALNRGAKKVQNWRATVQSLCKWTIDSGTLLHKGQK